LLPSSCQNTQFILSYHIFPTFYKFASFGKIVIHTFTWHISDNINILLPSKSLKYTASYLNITYFLHFTNLLHLEKKSSASYIHLTYSGQKKYFASFKSLKYTASYFHITYFLYFTTLLHLEKKISASYIHLTYFVQLKYFASFKSLKYTASYFHITYFLYFTNLLHCTHSIHFLPCVETSIQKAVALERHDVVSLLCFCGLSSTPGGP
jgi:hypothetical protein